MGIPKFFSWLREKYPSIVDRYVQRKQSDGFDNLYLDMNDIIHICCHSENGPLPISEEEKFEGMSKFIDTLMEIVRPKKMLFIAMEGVTPFAKNNNRRQKKFLNYKKDREAEAGIERRSADEFGFDYNSLCPGTDFMSRLHVHLRAYIADRIRTQPRWVGIKVILSDASVPGEGEHKIMEIIRSQRATPTHDINTRHCIHGNDADLIILGLATHEPNFSIIKEEIPLCDWCNKKGHIVRDCENAPRQEREVVQEEKLIFVHLKVLRKCLEKEMYVSILGSGVHNINRTIDDWVFLCCLLGNDFLPKLPSLNIKEGALDRLVRMYKTAVTHTMINDLKSKIRELSLALDGKSEEIDPDDGDKVTQTQSVRIDTEVNQRYLTDNGIVNLHMLQMILTELGKEEDVIFRERRQKNEMNSKYKCEIQHESEDNVRLGMDGWKDRYYEYKFDVSPSHEPEFINNLADSYVKGLCWISMYYFHGCPSWQWFYPYHYAPFAMDFKNITHLQNDFEVGEPLKPLEQLMAILPPSNDHLLPITWRPLMIGEPGDSPIRDFYPGDFEIDLSGERYTSQGVARIPFVDETRMKKALEGLQLTRDEECRNRFGNDVVFLDVTHPAYVFFKQFGNNNDDDEGCVVLDADKWILEQIEHHESELHSRLYTKELEIDYYARAQRLEEIPLLKKDYEKFVLMERETWDKEEEKKVQNLKEVWKLAKLNRNRLSRMVASKDEFVKGLTHARKCVYKEKLAIFKTMYDNEKKIRLEQRKVDRKEDRRQKWLKEKKEEKQRKRDEEIKRVKQAKDEEEYRIRVAKANAQAAKQKARDEEIERRNATRSRQSSVSDDRTTDSWRRSRQFTPQDSRANYNTLRPQYDSAYNHSCPTPRYQSTNSTRGYRGSRYQRDDNQPHNWREGDSKPSEHKTSSSNYNRKAGDVDKDGDGGWITVSRR